MISRRALGAPREDGDPDEPRERVVVAIDVVDDTAAPTLAGAGVRLTAIATVVAVGVVVVVATDTDTVVVLGVTVIAADTDAPGTSIRDFRCPVREDEEYPAPAAVTVSVVLPTAAATDLSSPEAAPLGPPPPLGRPLNAVALRSS